MTTSKTAYSYIRFSTPDQQLGDSERRQLALAKDYCARHALQLVDKPIVDPGVSGFHGKHREKGNLGKLLKLIKPGETLQLLTDI